jgi:hypothetical protein
MVTGPSPVDWRARYRHCSAATLHCGKAERSSCCAPAATGSAMLRPWSTSTTGARGGSRMRWHLGVAATTPSVMALALARGGAVARVGTGDRPLAWVSRPRSCEPSLAPYHTHQRRFSRATLIPGLAAAAMDCQCAPWRGSFSIMGGELRCSSSPLVAMGVQQP